MSEELLNVGLPKWPALVVAGEAVTKEQAMEILVRTDGWYVSTNDKAWERTVYEIAGIKTDPKYGWPDHHDLERFRGEIGALNLEYLTNRRIAAAYVGGPHGWCSWGGNIGCSSYNIGKWPSVEEVFREWTLIAEAFPFLRLWSQLYNGETCEEGASPVVEFVIAEGRVTLQAPTDRPVVPESNLERDLLGLLSPGRERGCSAETLREALAQVRRLRGT